MLKIKRSKITKLCGWYGIAALIVAYLLVSFNIIIAGSYAFQTLSLSGNIGLFIDAKSKKIAELEILSLFWIAMNAAMIVRLLFS